MTQSSDEGGKAFRNYSERSASTAFTRAARAAGTAEAITAAARMTKADAGVLHYSREYIVRQLDLAPDKSADVSKLMAAINADENSSAVLKKK